ncbi:MAG TPA: S8 family serine peptidase, partial [Clostridia bacterium]|nr:S8 family serine peptidase [Clostridia bacterium]
MEVPIVRVHNGRSFLAMLPGRSLRLISCACVLAVSSVHAEETRAVKFPLERYAPDHILVRFKPGAVPAVAANSTVEYLSLLVSGLGLPQGARLEEPVVSRLLRAAGNKTTQAILGTPVDLDRFLYLHLPPGMTVAEASQRLAGHPWLDYAEPDGIGSGGALPNDPLLFQQWHHGNSSKPGADIRSLLAWDISRGSSNVLVAVLDTGLAALQPEFAGRWVPGFNFAYSNTDTGDDHGHGTAVAGVLAANANNAVMGAGVDWSCQLLPIKVLDRANFGYYSWWAQGVDYAVARGAKVLNLSAGGFTSDLTLSLSISNAIRQGAIFVTATHNDGTNMIRFPGNLVSCITVGATDETDRRAAFSNYGPQIDLVAPGTNIFTVGSSAGPEVWWGTSFAAPQVAGVCSLLAALRPDLNQEQARLLLCAGADDSLGDVLDAPGFDIYYGWGRLNAYHSMVL